MLVSQGRGSEKSKGAVRGHSGDVIELVFSQNVNVVDVGTLGTAYAAGGVVKRGVERSSRG